jgi:carboxyl-terminal processing protease
MQRLKSIKKLTGKHFCIILLLVQAVQTGCKKEREPVFDIGSNQYINKWVLDSMKVYYYWNTVLPKTPNYNQQPLSFFGSIKNGADRFSQLLNPDVPESYPRTLYSDFGIDLVTISAQGGEQTILRLVVPGSDGFQAGLKRGDRILAINGIAVNSTNVNTLSEASLKNGSITLQMEGKPEPYLINGYLKPNPVYTTQVWERSGKKIGYIFLNNFDVKALPKLKEVFAGFRDQQVSELVLDMRYNTGGEVSVAAALAAMITRATEGDVFLEYRGNANAGVQRHGFGNEIGKLFTPVNYSQYAGLRLNINRIFILTGRHTASAAELLVNNLPPYISTIRIGEPTLGKDMAEFEIKDYRSPKLVSDWTLWPLVFKVYNSAGKGDYAAGLPPDIAADELSILPLKELGDPDETLTRLAVAQITGIAVTSNRALSINSTPNKLYDARDKEDAMVTPIRVSR